MRSYVTISQKFTTFLGGQGVVSFHLPSCSQLRKGFSRRLPNARPHPFFRFISARLLRPLQFLRHPTVTILLHPSLLYSPQLGPTLRFHFGLLFLLRSHHHLCGQGGPPGSPTTATLAATFGRKGCGVVKVGPLDFGQHGQEG